MSPTNRVRASLIPPLAAMGIIGAWLSAEFFRIGDYQVDRGVRGLMIFIITVASATIAFALSARWVMQTDRRSFIVLAFAVPSIGAACGTLVSTILNGRDDASAGALQGGLASLPFLPLVFIVLVLCRRVGRARFGSVIDGADRRAPWLVLCCATALGSAPAVMGQSRGRWASVDVTLALAVLAALAALFFLVRDALAFRETTRATRLAAGVRPASFEQREDEEIPVIDLGIGEEEVRCTSTPTSAYRGGGDLHAVVLGDPWTASLALRHAVTRSALGFVLCLAGIGGMVAAVGERGYDVLPF